MSGNTSSTNLVQMIVLICENNIEFFWLNPTACEIIVFELTDIYKHCRSIPAMI